MKPSFKAPGVKTLPRRRGIGMRLAWWVARLATFAAVLVAWQMAVDRGLMPEDHTIWLENPASSALESLLAEL